MTLYEAVGAYIKAKKVADLGVNLPSKTHQSIKQAGESLGLLWRDVEDAWHQQREAMAEPCKTCGEPNSGGYCDTCFGLLAL